MNAPDLKVFTAILESLAETYKEKLTHSQIELFWQALKSFELSVVQRAIRMHVVDSKRGRKMPLVSDIIYQIEGQETTSLHAWNKVLQAVRYIGDWPSVVFDDPIIHVVLEALGGWVRFNQLTVSSERFVQREFESLYRHYIKISSFSYPAQLFGRSEGVTAYQPTEGRQPVLLGNRQKAIHVFSQGEQSSINNISSLEHSSLSSSLGVEI